jgi:Sigma-70, region 4
MDELEVFCARILGGGDAAGQAALEARSVGGEERVTRLAAAVAACRARGDAGEIVAPGPAAVEPGAAEAPPDPVAADSGLAQTVAHELQAAAARLPDNQREALALRELLGLSYEQIAGAIGVETTAVAPLLADARLQLRTQLRGPVDQAAPCGERDRAVRMMAQRQDAEPLSDAEDSWLLEHLGECVACKEAHAAMLEASVCYRAWQVDDGQWEGRQASRVGQPASADAVQ